MRKRISEENCIGRFVHRKFRSSAEQVSGYDVRVGSVDNCVFMRSGKKPVRVVHEVLVERVCHGDKDCKGLGPGSPGAPACCRVDIMVPG